MLNTEESPNNGQIGDMALSVVERCLLLGECLTITYVYGKFILLHEVCPFGGLQCTYLVGEGPLIYRVLNRGEVSYCLVVFIITSALRLITLRGLRTLCVRRFASRARGVTQSNQFREFFSFI